MLTQQLPHTHTQLRVISILLTLMLHFQQRQQKPVQVGTTGAVPVLQLQTPTVQLSTISGAVPA